MGGVGPLPPIPPVMVRADSVTYTGQAAADSAALFRLALSVLGQQSARSGVEIPERYRVVLHGAELAEADMRTSSDVRESPTSASSAVGRWVGVSEAARLFGVTDRQARRIVREAGGEKTRKGWRIAESALQAEYELRRTA